MDKLQNILKALKENHPIKFKDGFRAGLITGLGFFCTPEEMEELEFQTSYDSTSSTIFVDWLEKVYRRLNINRPHTPSKENGYLP